MRRFSCASITKISIEAVDYVDFKKVDLAIQHNGQWLESCPMRTGISVPSERAEDIIAKLKLQDGITAVNGELTPCGEKWNAQALKDFERQNGPINR